MIIKHAKNPANGVEFDNVFVAADEAGRELGSCRVDSMFCQRLFPLRPHQICIEYTGDVSARAALLGAAGAQAMVYAMQENVPARIFCPCDPEDGERAAQLDEMGYEDNDGLVRMAKFIKAVPENPPMPEGLIVLHDQLEDTAEARYFLKRYNRLYGVEDTLELVDEWSALPGFRRYLIIDEDGLLGEVLVALEGNVGRILFIQVNANYCRMGLGTYLMQLAIHMLAKRGAQRIEMDVRVRIPYIMRMLGKLGFEQYQLLERYPGMDWNPGADRKLLQQRMKTLSSQAWEEDEESFDEPQQDIPLGNPLAPNAPIAQDPDDWDL